MFALNYYLRQGDIDKKEIRYGKSPSKRQKRTGLIATARESLCHERSVYNTLVLILKNQECDIIAHAKKKGKS